MKHVLFSVHFSFTQATATWGAELVLERDDDIITELDWEEVELRDEELAEELVPDELEELTEEELREEELPEHVGLVMVLLSMVTAPTRASALPFRVMPVASEMDWSAMMVPANSEVVPKVADVPTCQKILQACAPPTRMTLRPEVVVSVEAIWKMNTAFASPPASNVRSPEVTESDDVDL